MTALEHLKAWLAGPALARKEQQIRDLLAGREKMARHVALLDDRIKELQLERTQAKTEIGRLLSINQLLKRKRYMENGRQRAIIEQLRDFAGADNLKRISNDVKCRPDAEFMEGFK